MHQWYRLADFRSHHRRNRPGPRDVSESKICNHRRVFYQRHTILHKTDRICRIHRHSQLSLFACRTCYTLDPQSYALHHRSL